MTGGGSILTGGRAFKVEKVIDGSDASPTPKDYIYKIIIRW